MRVKEKVKIKKVFHCAKDVTIASYTREYVTKKKDVVGKYGSFKDLSRKKKKSVKLSA